MTAANDIQLIDFTLGESYVMDKLSKYSDIDIKNNIKWLYKHSVRYNYYDLLKNIIDICENFDMLKNLNVEYSVKSFDILKLLDENNLLDISFLNYYLLEYFIRNNNIDAVDYILNKYTDNIDYNIINNLNLRGMKSNMKNYLKSKNLWKDKK